MKLTSGGAIISLQSFIVDSKVEGDEVSCVHLLRLSVIGNIDQRYHRHRVRGVYLLIQLIARVLLVLGIAVTLCPVATSLLLM